MTHTPGPWHTTVEAHEINIFSVNGWHICGLAIEDEHAQDNAHLIAGAPDLLAACEAAVRHNAGYYGSAKYRAVEDDRVMSLLKAAIAKAKGEQP